MILKGRIFVCLIGHYIVVCCYFMRNLRHILIHVMPLHSHQHIYGLAMSNILLGTTIAK